MQSYFPQPFDIADPYRAALDLSSRAIDFQTVRDVSHSMLDALQLERLPIIDQREDQPWEAHPKKNFEDNVWSSLPSAPSKVKPF